MNNEISAVLAKKGYNIPQGEVYDLQAVWKSWYRGNVNDFHYYNEKLVDGSVIQVERYTLGMAKKLCEDFAKLSWSEKVKINLDNEDKTRRLWEVLDSKENNFSIMFPDLLEKTYALGTGLMVEYLVDGKIKIDYITGETIIPYAYDNSYISGIMILSQFNEGYGKDKLYYTLMTYHEFKGGLYTKYHELYKSKKENELGKLVDFNERYPDVDVVVEYESDTPHFQVIKPRITNNFDFSSPMGISIFANSIDKLKAIDIKFNSLINEFELGKKRILVDKTATKGGIEIGIDGSLNNISYFDKNDRAFMAINGMENQPIKEIDFTLRVQEHLDALNADLNYLSAGVGLGQNFYSFDKDGLKTATEVISEKSDTFRTKQHHQIVIKDAIYDLVKSILFLLNIESEITIVFDDSIIEDENAKIDRGLKLFAAGVISKETFMLDYLGLTEKQAEDEMKRIKEETKVILPEGLDFFGG